jgi:hypothetical protein
MRFFLPQISLPLNGFLVPPLIKRAWGVWALALFWTSAPLDLGPVSAMLPSRGAYHWQAGSGRTAFTHSKLALYLRIQNHTRGITARLSPISAHWHSPAPHPSDRRAGQTLSIAQRPLLIPHHASWSPARSPVVTCNPASIKHPDGCLAKPSTAVNVFFPIRPHDTNHEQGPLTDPHSSVTIKTSHTGRWVLKGESVARRRSKSWACCLGLANPSCLMRSPRTDRDRLPMSMPVGTPG